MTLSPAQVERATRTMAMEACLAGRYDPPEHIQNTPRLLNAWRDGTMTIDYYQLDRIELPHLQDTPI